MVNDTLTAQIEKQNIDINTLAKNLMKKSVNIGEAVVTILGNFGIAGFKFHVPQGEQVNMENDITDHYIDTGSAVQDHIARRPITITLNGFQGEYFYSANPIEDTIAKITPVMSLVKQFLPKLSDVTQRIKARKNEQARIQINEDGSFIKNYKNRILDKDFNAIDLFKLFQDLYKLKSAQTRAFYFFEALWKSEALFSVETTWRRYDNMVIQKILPVRDNNADITDFTVTFKQISITTSKTESLKDVAGRLKEQMAEVTQKGVDKGKEVDTLNPQ